MASIIILCFGILIILGALGFLLAEEKKPILKVVEPEKSAITEVAEMPEEGKWSPRSIGKEFDSLKNEINGIEGIDAKPGRGESVKGFFSRINYAFRLTMQEKEIITFALLQWVSIAVGYYLWVQMLDWIPPEVWKSAASSDSCSIADCVLMVWSFVCVGVAAFPLSIFSSCMGAVHFLRRQGKRSTIAGCLKIVLPRVWPLWMFHWIDGWITVNQILKRLPKKNDRTTPAQRALSEALYYAWKIGTIGILPSLVTGRGMVESCKQSVSVVRHKFKEVTALRVGYSSLCWIVGIAAYVGAIFFFMTFSHLVPKGEEIYGGVYTFYFWAAIPILVAVGIVQLFLRPIYIISACDIYSDYLTEKQEKVMLPTPPSKGISALVAFLVLVVVLIAVFLFRDELGITNMLSTPYGATYVPQ